MLYHPITHSRWRYHGTEKKTLSFSKPVTIHCGRIGFLIHPFFLYLFYLKNADRTVPKVNTNEIQPMTGSTGCDTGSDVFGTQSE